MPFLQYDVIYARWETQSVETVMWLFVAPFNLTTFSEWTVAWSETSFGRKVFQNLVFGEFYASFNRIISGPGMPLQVFIKLFFSLFGLSKYVIQQINNPNNFSSLPQLPRAQHDVEQPGWPDVSLPDCLRPLHAGHYHRLDQPPHCYDVRHLPKDTGPSIFPTMR